MKPSAVFRFIAATAFNLVVIAALFFGFLALWGLLLAPTLKLTSSSLVILPAFLVSIAGSAFIYRAAARLYARRRSVEERKPLTKT